MKGDSERDAIWRVPLADWSFGSCDTAAIFITDSVDHVVAVVAVVDNKRPIATPFIIDVVYSWRAALRRLRRHRSPSQPTSSLLPPPIDDDLFPFSILATFHSFDPIKKIQRHSKWIDPNFIGYQFFPIATHSAHLHIPPTNTPVHAKLRPVTLHALFF